MSPESLLGYWTGLAFLAPDLPLSTLWRTALIVHTCDAVLCALLARGSNRSPLIWSAVGFVAGIWALALLFVLPVRPQR